MSEQNREEENTLFDRQDQNEQHENTEVPNEELSSPVSPPLPPSEHAEENGEKKEKKERRISLPAFLISSVAMILAAVMLTFSICQAYYREKLADALVDQNGSPNAGVGAQETVFDEFFEIFEQFSFEDLNQDEMMAQALKAYVYATGDRYAEYYTREEYLAMAQASAGETEGIGISIINTTALVNGTEYKVFRVIHVEKDSPAERADMRIGDMIYAVGTGEQKEIIQVPDLALAKLQGAAGTTALFSAFRNTDQGYASLDFEIKREKITTASIYHRVCESDPKVGIVKFLQFDLTTPTQLDAAMADLTAKGCEKFIFDVRYNPGGDLRSIEAVLSRFLKEGDTLIQTKTKSGYEETSCVKEVYYTGAYAGCSVKREDIGKYRDLPAVVLCNESTASAAELFTATFRDYSLAPTVGMKTFGKGSMQSIMELSAPYYGALKLTVAMYYPASGVGYDGEGIKPDHTVELSREAAEKNIYDLPDSEDAQLQKALELLR